MKPALAKCEVQEDEGRSFGKRGGFFVERIAPAGCTLVQSKLNADMVIYKSPYPSILL